MTLHPAQIQAPKRPHPNPGQGQPPAKKPRIGAMVVEVIQEDQLPWLQNVIANTNANHGD